MAEKYYGSLRKRTRILSGFFETEEGKKTKPKPRGGDGI